MEQLNSSASRSNSGAENMRALQQAINIADQRIKMRRATNANVRMTLGTMLALPLSTYLIYNFFAASGVMQNHKASSGAYGYFASTWLLKPRNATTIYRPEIERANQQGALF